MKAVFEVYPVVNGPGTVTFAWQKSLGNYLAITGVNKVVNIYDRHGEHKSEVLIVLPGLCTSMDWDKDGDVLAITQDKNGTLFLWNAHNFDVTKLDTGMKEPLTLCLWAKRTHLLALATTKGNLLLYNHRTRRKIPILGKHTRKITCGAWSAENLLALGSEDRTLTISNAEGDTLRQAWFYLLFVFTTREQKTTLRAEPYDIQFSHVKSDSQSSEETTVSVVIGNKTLFLYDMDNADNPIELAFQPRYGDITTYKWYGDGHLMIGFSNGFFVVISTHKDEIGQELFQSRNHKNFLSDVAISFTLNQAASCGDNCIKIHDLQELKEVYTIIDVEEEKGTLHCLDWTDDGQLLTVSTMSGGVFTYLAKLPMLGDACGSRLAYLTSLLEITVVNNVEEEPALKLDVGVEPSFIALGPFHIAVGMNDRAWIHEIGEQGEVFERSYLGNVASMQLNGFYAAALFEGKIQLHQIDPSLDTTKDTALEDNDPRQQQRHREREDRMFPEEGREDTISCMSLTQDFLIYGTEGGSLIYFYTEDWQIVNEFKHVIGITKVFPDSSATRLVLVDEKSDAFIYNPVNDALVEVPEFPPGAKGILWENWPLDKHVFVAYDEENVYTYVHYRDTVQGPVCEMAGVTKLPFGHRPLMLYNGEVSCQTLTGKISIMRLNTHIFGDDQEITEEELKTSMQRCIILKRFKDAWSFATAMDSVESWNELAMSALHHLEVDLAIRVYQQIKSVAMVYSLQQLQHVEDRNLLVGHIATFMENYNQAQELFLASSNPVAALEMRRDLLHWDQALNLARTLAPNQIPFISREYAQQLEFTGDHANALLHYEKGITKSPEDAEHDEVCNGGVARMAIKTGDIRRGVSIAQSMSSKQLKKECATILEGLKLYMEAGVLYEKAQSWDKAAAVYIKLKNWNKVGELFSKVSSPKLHAQYAKAREADGHFKEAARAYEAAKDYDNAVRLYVEQLHSPDEAVRIVKESQSVEGAKMVARFFQKIGDFASALQFLVLSHCNEEAYTMAEAHNQMEQYAEVIGSDATKEDYLRIASHFQRTGESLKAGQFFLRAKEYAKALHHFLHCSPTLYPDGENIDMAIETVGHAKQESLTQQLTDYLMGDTDGVPKDAKYLFRLYMALEQYRDAARTAILIAREDQAAGNYRNAHDVLFYMYSELMKHKIRIPSEMVQNLMLLHSYILVKLHVKHGDHLKGARMLIRVANSISKFPSHIVPILTSTVIECHRSGLKGSSFSFAAMLMRPEYRQSIDPKWKKKIEQIVRKPDKSEIEEPLEPCPYCAHPVPQTKLDCPQCKNNIPYCIVTGCHMTKGDWTECPVCKFPALYSEFRSLLEKSDEPLCPMCSNSVKAADLKKIEELSSALAATDTGDA